MLHAALPDSRSWPDRPTEADIAALPAVPAVLLLVSADGAAVQLSSTQDLRRMLRSRLLDAQRVAQGKADLAAVVRGVRWIAVHSAFEARWRYFRLARELHPASYRDEIDFGPAWFLCYEAERAAPEIRVTDRVFDRPGEMLGPWPTQGAAKSALDALCDLFDLCRYPEQVRRAPLGQRCAYAEMGRCDAPCDGSAPLAAYRERSEAAWRFAAGGQGAWRIAADERMRAAAAARQYERAAQIKRQIASASCWANGGPPGGVLRVAEWCELLLVPAVRRRAWVPYLFRRGALESGPLIASRALAIALPDWFSAKCASPEPDTPPVLRTEQSWLVAHLYFSRAFAGVVREPIAPGARDLAECARRAAQRAAELRAESAVSFDDPPNVVDTSSGME